MTYDPLSYLCLLLLTITILTIGIVTGNDSPMCNHVDGQLVVWLVNLLCLHA